MDRNLKRDILVVVRQRARDRRKASVRKLCAYPDCPFQAKIEALCRGHHRRLKTP